MSTQTLIDAIDVKLAVLIESPQVDYKIGDKTVSAGQYIKQLTELRAELIKNPDADAVIMAFDFDITEFGEDRTQHVL